MSGRIGHLKDWIYSEDRSASAKSYVTILEPFTDKFSLKDRQFQLNRLLELRKLVLLERLPFDRHEARVLRPLVWKALLSLAIAPDTVAPVPGDFSARNKMNATQYFLLCTSKSPSAMFNKIKNDTFRTLATDEEFQEKVGEEKLIRCLEAFVWRQSDRPVDASSTHTATSALVDRNSFYVQGMNVLCSPFLYVMSSELEAFACYATFIEVFAPRYVRPTLNGVHDGLKLVELCLEVLDPPLYDHLQSFKLSAELYAFPSLLTFSACTPPLDQVIELWDFLLAWGMGLNVLCVVAQLYLMKDQLLSSPSPMKILRTFPPLQTGLIVPLVVQFLTKISPTLYRMILLHTWDDSIVIDSLDKTHPGDAE